MTGQQPTQDLPTSTVVEESKTIYQKDRPEHISTILGQVTSQLFEASPAAVLSTGYELLDSSIGGLRPGSLTLLAARPGMGKELLALNILLNAARSDTKKSFFFFSSGASREEIVRCFISCETFLDINHLCAGNLTPEEQEKLKLAVDSLSQMNILIDDAPAHSINEIKDKCHFSKDLGLIIIDNLESLRLKTNKSLSEEQIAQADQDNLHILKELAEEFAVPVICLYSLTCDIDKRCNLRPMPADLHCLGKALKDIDATVFLYRNGVYFPEVEDADLEECYVSRSQYDFSCKFELQWIPQFLTFTSIDRRFDLG